MGRHFGRNVSTLVACLCFGSALAAVDIQIEQDYDILLDDGHMLRKVTVISSDAINIIVTIPGLAETVKVPRRAIRSAILLAKTPFFKEFALQAFGDFQLSLADLQLLNSYFPGAGLSFTAALSKPLRVIRAHAFSVDSTFARASDGERVINAVQLGFAPQWHLKLFDVTWHVGVGGGIAGFYLVSFNFSRYSYAPIVFADWGAFRNIGQKFRLFAAIRGTYWADSQATLASLGFRMGVGYVW